ncbi:MAG: competence/damage-inducible protein A [Cyclobacteriaceae bacterium]|nr:competence/damage-inducible protein A [Cyclobacteriaceae bacterium SS2]
MKQTLAEIVSIGDEILYGQTLDTNSHWISGALDQIGIKVIRKTTVPDIETEILTGLKEAESRADVILITGGLGPTKDDLTKPLLARYFGVDLMMNEDALNDIEQLFTKANRKMTELNRMQAELPANCDKITNQLGTAPGMWFNERGKIFVSMPGVPYEMKRMMTDFIIPRLQEELVNYYVVHQMIMTIGIPESSLAEKISVWEEGLPKHIKLAYLPTKNTVKLRLTATGPEKAKLEHDIREEVMKLTPLIQKYIFGYDEGNIELFIGKMLKEANKTIACAESCTGGFLSHLITSIPGSSAYFKGAVIAYSNEVKHEILNVETQTLEKYGAVSEEVVLQMAKNVREKLNADIGLSISGVAGPDGGTEEKPVGLIWFGYSDKEKTIAKKYNFSKDRILNIEFGARKALDLLRINLSEK